MVETAWDFGLEAYEKCKAFLFVTLTALSIYLSTASEAFNAPTTARLITGDAIYEIIMNFEMAILSLGKAPLTMNIVCQHCIPS